MKTKNDGIWDWNVKTGEMKFNQEYFSMLGYDETDFSDNLLSWMGLIHIDDLEWALYIKTNCIKGRSEVFRLEYRMLAENGEWRWILSQGRCEGRDENGRALRITGTHTDISDQRGKKAQKSMGRSA
jgi:PAS domain S-box-containing protein